MKNWEFYEHKILSLKNCWDFAIINGELAECSYMNCDKCWFSNTIGLCQDKKIQFLYQEHKEPIRLTDDEKALCKLLERGWIARDRNGELYWYPVKPHRVGERWGCDDTGVVWLDKAFPQCKFEFVSCNEAPWEVQVDD